MKTKTFNSRIFTLVVGLILCASMFVSIAAISQTKAYAEGTDPRTVVSTITATSNVDEIIGFGKSVVRPSFNIEEDVPAQFQTQYNWQKKTATGGWERYTSATFMEGTYIYRTQIRIDSDSGGGTTHVLDKNGITVTVNDVKWDNSTPEIYAEYSFAWIESKEYLVVAPAGTPLEFFKNKKWDIDSTYINQAITAFSVVDGAAGGTKPYTFSKVSGPEWLDVSADGTVSGTPTDVGKNEDLVIKVTDSAVDPASKEITLKVGKMYVLPADREVISVIRVTSNIGEIIGYGKSVVKPSFTFTEGTQANFPYIMGHWYKKEGTAWKRYNEATFTEGIYRYSNQLRVDDEYGRTHVLNKDGVSVYIDGELRADNQKPEIYDTFSLIYVDTAEYEVIKTTTITDELVPVTDLEKVYDDNPQEPTFSGALVRGTDYEVSYTVKAGSTGSLFGGIPLGAGTYIVTVTGKGAYSGSFTKEFVINKAEQTDVPVGIIANPISCNEGLGVIDGVTTAMEYRKVGEADFTACTSSKITGLAAGEYEIRYKEDDNYLAGAVTKVSVVINHNFGAIVERQEPSCSATGMEAHYYCHRCDKYFDKSKNEKTLDELTIPKDPAKHNFSDLVSEKPATCNEDGMKAHYKCVECGRYFDESKNEKTLEELTIAATGVHDWNAWVSNGNGTHTRTCNNGSHNETENCSGGTATCENKAVCSVCGAEYGTKLGHDWGKATYTWTDNTCKAERVCKHDSAHIESETVTATETTITAATCKEKGKMKYTAIFVNTAFTVQEKEVDIDFAEHTYGTWIEEIPATTENFGTKGHYECSVCGKYFDKDGNEITDLRIAKIGTHVVTVKDGAGETNTHYKSGDTVTIKATVPTGKHFVKWSVVTGISLSAAQIKQEEITFTMPDNDVTITAQIEDSVYSITVTDGTSTSYTATYQQEVTVTANEPDVDEFFDKWEVTGLDTTGMDLTKTEIKFQMPAGNVTFKATYLRVTKYGIVIVDGTKDKEVAKAGEIVTITAGTKEGKVFDKWTCETAGVTIEFASTTSARTTFVMPAREIEIKAHFRNIGDAPSVEIKVDGGTGAGTYKQGESVTVTAEDKEGKEFKGWKDESGEIVSTKKSYTFTVAGEKTLTAVYSEVVPNPTPDNPSEVKPSSKGLTGGQVAGIVIGTLLLAGIGGFAIFWFAVKKKTFADLGAILKKGFTAIGNFFKNLGAKIKGLFDKKQE